MKALSKVLCSLKHRQLSEERAVSVGKAEFDARTESGQHILTLSVSEWNQLESFGLESDVRLEAEVLDIFDLREAPELNIRMSSTVAHHQNHVSRVKLILESLSFAVNWIDASQQVATAFDAADYLMTWILFAQNHFVLLIDFVDVVKRDEFEAHSAESENLFGVEEN